MNAAPPAVIFTVEGTPRTKGSLRALHRKRPDGRCFVTLFEQGGNDLKAWRTLVATAAKQAMKHNPPLRGALSVALTFYFARPASHTDVNRANPFVFGGQRHDIDKLARLALDAMTDAAVYNDDSQVAVLCAEKRYNARPGVVVTVEQLTAPEVGRQEALAAS